jgi:transcriptional regulator with XRE-family HTH domain
MAKYLHDDDDALPECLRFGARLRERRLALRLSQGELFELTGITASYISFIERGKGNPTLEMMVKLSNAVGSTVAEMVCDPSEDIETIPAPDTD